MCKKFLSKTLEEASKQNPKLALHWPASTDGMVLRLIIGPPAQDPAASAWLMSTQAHACMTAHIGPAASCMSFSAKTTCMIGA